MDQIVLKLNLKYIVAGLSATQKGNLFDLILGIKNVNEIKDSMVENIYRFIESLQQETLAKKNRMREIGAKGNAAKRALKQALLPLEEPNALTNTTPTHSVPSAVDNIKRKEPKENNKINTPQDTYLGIEGVKGEKGVTPAPDSSTATRPSADSNNSLPQTSQALSPTTLIPSSEATLLALALKAKKHRKRHPEPPFIPPTVEEVTTFVAEKNLKLEAETFVDFYTARGWQVGNTAIRNWQAMARLWHRRATEPTPYTLSKKDETYWSELETRVLAETEATSIPDTAANPDSGSNTIPITAIKTTPQPLPPLFYEPQKHTPLSDSSPINPLVPFAEFSKKFKPDSR